MEYKSVMKYLDKNKANKKSFLNKIITKLCFVILITIIGLILVKYDSNNKKIISKYLNDKNINMATINKWYKEHFGDILPFQNIVKDKTKLVFNDKLQYSDLEKIKNGVKLSVSSSYLVPLLESGIVVFSGEKEGFGKTIIVEQTNGVDVWYGNIKNPNINLYDYVSKGEFVGEASDTLYLAFQKDGEFLNYENYLK